MEREEKQGNGCLVLLRNNLRCARISCTHVFQDRFDKLINLSFLKAKVFPYLKTSVHSETVSQLSKLQTFAVRHSCLLLWGHRARDMENQLFGNRIESWGQLFKITGCAYYLCSHHVSHEKSLWRKWAKKAAGFQVHPWPHPPCCPFWAVSSGDNQCERKSWEPWWKGCNHWKEQE